MRKISILLRLVLNSVLALAKIIIQTLWIVIFYNKLEVNLKKKRQIYIITGTLGETFLSLLALSLKHSPDDDVVIFIYEKFKGLVNYFANLRTHIHFLNSEDSFFLFTVRRILAWHGTVAFLRKYDTLIGIPEVTKYKNLALLGTRFSYLKGFYLRSKNSPTHLFNQNSYVKYMLDFPEANFEEAAKLLSRNRDLAYKIAEENGIIPGKTVLLAPYSNFLRKFSQDPDFLAAFEEIAAFLNKYGYRVFTNVDSANPKPIAGTLPISPPLEILIDFAELCGNVIAIRSGLTDILACSSVRLFVYYPELRILKTDAVDYFSLGKEFPNSQVFEYCGPSFGFLEFIKTFFSKV